MSLRMSGRRAQGSAKAPQSIGLACFTGMSRSSILLSAIALAIVLVLSTYTGGLAQGVAPEVVALQQSLSNVLAQPSLSAAWVGVRVETVQGEVLFDFNGSKLFMPASNMKVITAAAGLELLGADYTWETRVWADRWEEMGIGTTLVDAPLPATLQGNLYLQGGGDPTLLQEDLQRLARSLYARGLREVTGDLVYDDSFFDSTLRGNGWEWDYLDAYYAAPVSGLALSPDRDYDANTIKVSVYPSGALFDAGIVVLSPNHSGVTVINETRTAGASATATVSATWKDDRTLVVSGHTPLGKAPGTMWIAVKDPARIVGNVFVGALQDAGIMVRGSAVAGRLQGQQTLVATHQSMPLSQLLIPFMKLSNNGHGEVIVKTLGKKFRSQGSWSAGIATLSMFLKDIVRVPGPFNIADGSGLSRKNHVSPEQLAAVFRYMVTRPNFAVFYNSLPVAGAPDRLVGGTLRSRMQGTPAQYNARAKTGSLNNVSALSGYVNNASGDRLVFSIMLNHAVDVSSTMYQDAIVNVLARYKTPAP